MKTETVANRVWGKRILAGTEWPIEDVVEKHSHGKSVRWVLVKGLCNGIPDGCKEFRTKKEALARLARWDNYAPK